MDSRGHQFIEEYKGLVGFGLDRETDEASITVYLQLFSDDRLMAVLRERLTDDEIEEILGLITSLLKKHLNHQEYHDLFLGNIDS